MQGGSTAPLITLLTDFGTSDTYAAQMKGAILSVNPRAVIVDLTHEVQPQQVLHGAFLLETAVGAFPAGTVHVAVVDPGVGTERRAVAIATGRAVFVGPDNGLLSAALPDGVRPGGSEPAVVAVPAGVQAVELREPIFRRPAVSATFHGRDIFGPAGAHLALGAPLEEFGPRVERVIALPPFRARRDPSGRLHGRVVSIDHFGNVITDCRDKDLPAGPLRVRLRGAEVPGLAATYGVASGLTALVGSSGFLEVAMPGGSAAGRLHARIGDIVTVEPAG